MVNNFHSDLLQELILSEVYFSLRDTLKLPQYIWHKEGHYSIQNNISFTSKNAKSYIIHP